MNHTPGPWVVDGDDDGLFIRMEALSGKDEYLAIYASDNPEQREADAFLIAAAPDLLDACEEAVDALEAYAPNLKVIATLEAAIAKARGEA